MDYEVEYCLPFTYELFISFGTDNLPNLRRKGDLMTPTEQYIHDRDEQVRKNLDDRDLGVNTYRFTEELVRTNYTKNFTYMGIPILQYPTDLMVMQEIIWQVQPDYIIETGVAFGGMLIFYASILNAIGKGKVLGIDIDPRDHNMKELEKHPLQQWMDVVKGSSIDRKIIEAVKDYISPFLPNPTVLISLDSNHTHDHVLQELRLYSPLVSVGSYVVVFDTAIEDFCHLDKNQDRPWGKGNNPATAVKVFMEGNEEFIVDREVEMRAGITAAPGGWLKRVKEAS
jgi:cephalosporin hydroxylase